jgi:2-oxoglutarate ferredoxin oxidoreductase subunit alpha
MVATSLEHVVVRFVGDSGDGMQLVGSQFTLASAVAGNDLATLPDFPAEIRAPAGTTYGVSGFQLNFAHDHAFTPGDQPDVLICMNPAALKQNLPDLIKGGIIIANADAFTGRNLKLVEYTSSPLEDGSLKDYQLYAVPMTTLSVGAVAGLDLEAKIARRCTNFFALGLVSWLYNRPTGPTLDFIRAKFAKQPVLAEANELVFKAGFAYGETVEAFAAPVEVAAADIPPGEYRTINGNQALAYGLVTAAAKAGLECCFAGYPITPASSIIEELSGLRALGVKTIQAEDEIAAIGMALGASFAGALGVTASSGPGICLKGEFLGLALMTELPLVVIDVQRGGPSTGLPTKTEQSDLLLALFGRHGESPLPVLAARSPADAFDCALEAVRIAIRHMCPVLLLSDGSIANGAEPWLIPDPEAIPAIPVERPTDPAAYKPYARELDTLARPWAIPGMAGFAHRLGGLEKAHESGNVCYDPENHELMTRLRADKVQAVAQHYPALEVEGPERGRLLCLGWGSTYGAIAGACHQAREQGLAVAHCHLRHLWPLHPQLGELIARYERVLVPEINSGQLRLLLQSRYQADFRGYNRVRGQPLRIGYVLEAIKAACQEGAA